LGHQAAASSVVAFARRPDSEGGDVSTQSAGATPVASSAKGTPHLGVLRDDLSVMTSRARRRAGSAWQNAPYYAPRVHPVGRTLTVGTALNGANGASTIEGVELLPARQLADRSGEALDVLPLHAFSIAPARLITIRNRVDGVLAHDSTILHEVSTDYLAGPGAWTSFTRLQRYPEARQVGAAASLLTGAGGAVNYAHWLYDVLPRLHLLRQAGFVRGGERFITPPLDVEFKVTSLRRLGVEPSDCLEVDRPLLIECDRLGVTTGHRSHYRIEGWIPLFLREALTPEPIVQTGLRLYINRRDTKLRRVVNEDRLESLLATRGFTSVSMADYSLDEKIRLCASAEVIVAPHGSGLSNIAFCAPGTQIVEIKGDDHFQPWFEDVSRAVGLDYQVIEASRTVSSPLVPKQIRHQRIDLDRVIDAVDAVLG
jgi:capsular polysaccharide biosynthesis protein